MTDDLKRALEENREEAIQALKELVSIRSVKEDPVMTQEGEVYPFGKGVQDAFQYVLKKAEDMGFRTFNVENYGGHIDFVPADAGEASPDEGSEPDKTIDGEAYDAGTGPAGEGDYETSKEIVAAIGHLDVVPEGDGWDRGPYSGFEEQGYIWGRGTTDDKGPVLSVLYAMKSLRDAGIKPARKIRLILGLDEETDWEGVERYFESQPQPDIGFTPDAYFPVINGEKGIMSFKIAAKLPRTTVTGLVLRKLSGGTAVNMVPDHARAVVNDPDPKVYEKIREMAEAHEMSTGDKIRVQKMGKSLEISADGVAAHGSTPSEGENAISKLVGFLAGLNFVNEDISSFFDFYNEFIGRETDGKSIGCAMSDEESGDLTFNVGLIDYDRQAISITVDVRYPVTKTSDEVYDMIIPKLDENGLGILKMEDRPPLYFDPESPMIKTFMDVYRDNTGDTENGPLVTGGGTYARACKNTVAFGGLFPGAPDLMHQKNEKIETEKYIKMMEIYADALERLTDPDFSLAEAKGMDDERSQDQE